MSPQYLRVACVCPSLFVPQRHGRAPVPAHLLPPIGTDATEADGPVRQSNRELYAGGRCFTVVDLTLDGSPSCITIDAEDERRFDLSYRRAHQQL